MRAPRLMQGAKLTELSLTPFEGFILSRLDGSLGVDDVAELTGAEVSAVAELVARLDAAGVIEWVRATSSIATGRPPPTPASGEQRPPSDATKRPGRGPSDKVGRPARTPARGVVRTIPAPPDEPRRLYDPVELDEPGVDLDEDRRREILDAYYRLERSNHYVLLGVPRDADKKEIREAYFRLSKQFHPDTLFGKRLGTYQQKMEAVFRRLTDAYDVLGKNKTRRMYDDYLQTRDEVEAVDSGLAAGEAQATEVERTSQRVAAAALVEPTVAPEPSPAPSPRAPPPRAPSPPPPPPEPARPAREPSPVAGPRPALGEDERRVLARELLSRRLRGATGQGGRPPSTPRPAQPSSAPAPVDREALLRGLATSLKQAAHTTGGGKLERHLTDAATAEQADDLVSAVNALRLAAALAPERDDIARDLERVRHLLAKKMAGTYEKQAVYEEELGEWEAAARSWSRVIEGRPAQVRGYVRAVEALLRAKAADLKQAKELAARAVELKPDDAKTRALLGRVYSAAGMRANARRELEAAAKLDPEDDFVKNLLRELK
ncbi:MAG: DnaJ domain-containing protein [Myxococcales bacterium]|nr:DnaJ domain-containing protein [Myxococcales bacterium]